jgi:DNA-3-methyladenine glycosylase I
MKPVLETTNSCEWPSNDPLMIEYHDKEWGIPLHDDRKLFEYIVLDAFQAGLSWKTVLHKRENFRLAFENFEAEKIVAYDQHKIDSLIADAGIIRNKAKINATITNAVAFLRLQKEYGSFDKYIWQFTGHKTIQNHWTSLSELPARSPESDAMSKALMKEGFKFVGSTICYAFMQAAGMVNDHLVKCHRHSQFV